MSELLHYYTNPLILSCVQSCVKLLSTLCYSALEVKNHSMAIVVDEHILLQFDARKLTQQIEGMVLAGQPPSTS